MKYFLFHNIPLHNYGEEFREDSISREASIERLNRESN